MPRITFDGLRDPQVVHHFALEVQGIEEATFQEASGFENSNEVIEQRETGKGGKQYVSKQPGNLKWTDITLKRGVTGSMELYAWRQQVIDGNLAQARKSGSIVLYDMQNTEVSRFNFVRGWPSKWKSGDVKTSDNSALIEEITIAHEGIVRAS
ncbi:MAG TPA: phage tail protein [Dehalococcoidia bacterium]|jgi:phage tail-like protein|nr:phage tail protein [Dehalococcoidia bacterium]